MFLFFVFQVFHHSYAIPHLRILFPKDITIPITCPTSAQWAGGRVRLKRERVGYNSFTKGWMDVVQGAQLREGDICMFSFYEGELAMGCSVIKLRQ